MTKGRVNCCSAVVTIVDVLKRQVVAFTVAHGHSQLLHYCHLTEPLNSHQVLYIAVHAHAAGHPDLVLDFVVAAVSTHNTNIGMKQSTVL
jgi:hypothetical protein